MAGSSFVTGISGFCAVMNALSIFKSLPSIAANDFPLSGLLKFAGIAVTGLSLCGDLLLLTSAASQGPQINPMGTGGSLNKSLNKMLWGLCIKMFVVTYEFFTAPLYLYNCYLDVVILYVIHDFYEGVKQQGTLNSNGLLNDEDMQPLRGQAFTQGMPAFLPSGNMMAPGAPMQGLYPTGGLVAPGASMQGFYPGGGMMAQPAGLGYGFYPAGGMMAQPGAQGQGFYPAGGMMAPPGAQGQGFYPAGGMMAQPGALGQGFYPASGMMAPPGAQGQGFYAAGGMMAQPGALGQGFYPASGMMAPPGAQGQGFYAVGGMMAQPGTQGQGSYPAGSMGTPGAPMATGGSAVANTQSKADAASPSPAKPRHHKGSVANKPHANYPRSTY
nr:collagen alpha-2(IV) chain-like isoform X2 [Dermacentor andersoni]